jgi:hypothetical protein
MLVPAVRPGAGKGREDRRPTRPAAGRPVYEMLTPDGKTYVMQAYSHIIDGSLTMQSLAALGGQLQIPEGWQYRARTPDQEPTLTLATAGGQAHVLQDELQNTYMQLVTP